MPDFKFESVHWTAGHRVVAGVDEAGRGPLAGPVVAGAVVLPEDFQHAWLNDSKKLSAPRREALYEELTGNGRIRFASGMASVEEIDRLNILRATHLAMRRAVAALGEPGPEMVLIDGLPVRDFAWPQQAVVKGDALSLSIAAASIIAKVERDRLMLALDAAFPLYLFAAHKGYGTAAHLAALQQHGPSPHHRRSFQPVAQLSLDFSGELQPDKDAVGRRGEEIAARWLYAQGGKVLYRNYRGPKGGEVDIVCREGKVLAFVEVKTRTSTAFGRPAQAVTVDKQALIVRGATAYLRLLGARDIPWRLDVVEVLLIPGEKPAVNWIRAAFNTQEMRQTLAWRKQR